MRCLTICTLLLASSGLFAQEASSVTRKEDVIYGRKFGTCLTMDVFQPKEKANGAGVIFAVSGGWFSSKESINMGFIKPFTERGYVVFAVCHAYPFLP